MKVQVTTFAAGFLSAVLLVTVMNVNTVTPSVEGPAASSELSRREHNVMAVLWYQTAAEARALQYQAFNWARTVLDADLVSGKEGKKRAVVVDIDETILDNSPYEARAIVRNEEGYPHGWDEWIDMAQAPAIPGAVEFLQYAVSRGVDVFYVTNRKPRDREGTLHNLRKRGFPQADDSHLLLRNAEGSKEARRKAIAETHRIVLLLGDNLGDFSDDFQRKPIVDRAKEVDKQRARFGTEYIVLPNPIYGEWEEAVYDYNMRIPESEKNRLRKAHLRGY